MRTKRTTFYCFSPPVMIATCIIETSLLLYTLFRYRMNTVVRLAVATLGIHLIRVLSGRGSVWFVRLAYITGIMFALIFGLMPAAFQDHICAGNYAIFQLKSGLGGLYFGYYYGWLILGICQALLFAATAKINIRKALLYQVFGWLSFLLPTGIVNALNPQTISGIPSVMCGFAVIYAIVLVFGILPMANKPAKATKAPKSAKKSRG